MELSSPLNVGYSCKHESPACRPTCRPRLGGVDVVDGHGMGRAGRHGARAVGRHLDAGVVGGGSCAAGGHFCVALGPVSDPGRGGRLCDGGALRLQVCVLVPWRVFDRLGAGAVEPSPPVCVAHLGGRRRAPSTAACGIHGGHSCPQHVDFQHGHDPDDVAHRAVGLVQNQPRRPPSVPGGVVVGHRLRRQPWRHRHLGGHAAQRGHGRVGGRGRAGGAVFGMEHDGLAVFSAHVGAGVCLVDPGPVPRVVQPVGGRGGGVAK